ncbi:hypothetical protein HBI56_042440 [Parastagonospora nodorum]|uniref:Uncharacterized protein n=2 Tax=Phaeosphaeria nodorum (strain SN15 / ATCC MYA-4574 / FGSC 10173) TaxID=321614 RepID=A0A7U2EUX0_PHANO|nr:hypothetical protein HBH56_240660 [Parastagonospora nodorum]QRC93172.1 hypothetical protein JI435_034160 [Parastagonospora nodorum SN15]KAH3932295.1 hypothetical protein HBH54_083780 [Parastagonospora nodorum]KAH3954590.1 hypothetical protein HBH53_010590 [Parastagonospora nodorum]KAH3986021.1 hypothetical protein HBH52_041790 [Parastagonospora nodorum]
MKTVHCLLLCIVSRFVDASPARTDCGVTKTFEAVDLCSQTYGGTWVECASGMTATPTFSMSSCSVSASEIPIITSPPTVDNPGPVNGTECRPNSVCVDAGKMCGEGMRRYGTCYDMCTPSAGIMSTPTCMTELPPTTTPISLLGNVSIPAVPEREDNPACADMSFLCAPVGW